MNLSETPPLLAQAAADEMEITVGTVAAGMLVLAVLAASIKTCATWWNRFRVGQPLIPAAGRRLLPIPTVLLVVGLLIALMMSGSILLLGAGPTESEPAIDAAEAAVEAEGEGEDSAVVVAETDEAAGANGELSAEDLSAALFQTIVFDLMLIVLLGIPVILLKKEQGHESETSGMDPLTEEASALLATEEVVDADSEVGRSPYAPPGVEQPATQVQVQADEGWRFPAELMYAAEACLAAWLPTAGLKLLMAALFPEEGPHPFLELMQNGVGTGLLIQIVLTAVVLAPLMEELLYRVVILGGLLTVAGKQRTRFATRISVAVTSVLFAFAHGFPDSLALLPLAAVICWVYHQRRSYRTVVLVHVLFNGFNILLALLALL